MKLLQIILFVSPLFIFGIMIGYILTTDILCFGDICEEGMYWVGWLTGEWMLFYGIPATGYLIYRKIKQLRTNKTKLTT